MEENQTSILDDLETNLVQASSGQRFLNWLIDTIIFNIITRYGLSTLIQKISILPFLRNYILINFIYSLWTLVFFAIMRGTLEAVTKGRTIGKFITNTKAVNQNGTEITARTAFLRALIRLVPFEIFSALGTPCFPWHDKWTNTYVIDIKKSNIV